MISETPTWLDHMKFVATCLEQIVHSSGLPRLPVIIDLATGDCEKNALWFDQGLGFMV